MIGLTILTFLAGFFLGRYVLYGKIVRDNRALLDQHMAAMAQLDQTIRECEQVFTAKATLN